VQFKHSNIEERCRKYQIIETVQQLETAYSRLAF